MYIEITLSNFQKERLKKIEEKINNEIFWIPRLRNKMKKYLIKNKIIDIDLYYNWGNTYYEALFAAILTTETPSTVKVETIIKSIYIRDKECLFFFVKEILAKKNPICIIDSATKQLILAIIKKK